MPILRQLDLLVLALALAVFLAAGLPVLGWATAASLWLAQRGIQLLVTRRVAASKDPRTVVGLMAGSMLGRTWLTMLTILVVGLSDRKVGLSAAVLVLALFTVYFTVGMITRPFRDPPASTTPGGLLGQGKPSPR
jgi:hypothetical protein